MAAKYQARAQSAMEFMATYAWAFLLIAVVMASLYFFLQLPPAALPQRCQFVYGIQCAGINVGSSGTTTIVNIYLINGQPYEMVSNALFGNTIATIAMGSQYGTANAVCSPANVLQGGAVLCSVTMPAPIRVGKNVGGTIFLNSTICLQGQAITNCLQSQHVSYIGNFTTTVSGYTGSIPVTLALIVSPQIFSHLSAPAQGVNLNAKFTIFGKGARGADIVFGITSTTGSPTNTLSAPDAVSDPNGNANVTLIPSNTPNAGSITVSAAFGTFVATNTITIS